MVKSNQELYYYNSVDIFAPERSNVIGRYENLPGHELFKYNFRLFNVNISMVDRTNSITTPINIGVAPQCLMPDYDPTFSKGLAEITEQRARELLDHAQATGQILTVLYSGGIDSTLILVSLLKAGSPEEIKKNVLVLLNEVSIHENPNFYYDHIIRKFRCASSYGFRDFLGKPGYMVITGEGNDQLFGSAVLRDFVHNWGEQIIHEYATNKLMADLIDLKVKNRSHSERLVDVFNLNFDRAPIELPTVFHKFWWLNFTLKWQSVYMRLLAYTRPEYRSNIDLEHNYSTFFHIDDLQQWVLKNHNDLIGDTWLTYKQPCKDIIYDYNKDVEYRDRKSKWGSLFRVVSNKKLAWAFDSSFNFYDDCYPSWIWNEDNDFV